MDTADNGMNLSFNAVPQASFVSQSSRDRLFQAIECLTNMLPNISMRAWPQAAERSRECQRRACTPSTCRLCTGCLVMTALVSELA